MKGTKNESMNSMQAAVRGVIDAEAARHAAYARTVKDVQDLEASLRVVPDMAEAEVQTPSGTARIRARGNVCELTLVNASNPRGSSAEFLEAAELRDLVAAAPELLARAYAHIGADVRTLRDASAAATAAADAVKAARG